MHVAHRHNCIPTQKLNSPTWKKTANMEAFSASVSGLAAMAALITGLNAPCTFRASGRTL